MFSLTMLLNQKLLSLFLSRHAAVVVSVCHNSVFYWRLNVGSRKQRWTIAQGLKLPQMEAPNAGGVG